MAQNKTHAPNPASLAGGVCVLSDLENILLNVTQNSRLMKMQ